MNCKCVSGLYSFYRHCFSHVIIRGFGLKNSRRLFHFSGIQALHVSSAVYETVRVRFAPSPTGYLHLGGLRTALYNYLFSKRHGGAFILRIEDTDQTRIVPGSQENLEAMLDWIGLSPDESPSKGGNYGPYVQSKRTELYRERAYELLEKGAAYRCFCSEARLSLLRKEAARNHETPRYDNKCRHLSKSEIGEQLAKNKPFVIRFKISDKPSTFDDVIFGSNTLNISETEGDPVILKSDGYPTYHLACVVDDYLMKITHVLRGIEWQVSTPKHLMLYNAFEWKPPVFAHLPLILNKDGTKLSKRQGDIQVTYFKNNGYFPIALLNFICSSGGGFGKQGKPEILSLEELTTRFSLQHMNTNSCRLEPPRLETYNRLALEYLLKDDKTSQGLIDDLKTLIYNSYNIDSSNVDSRFMDDAYIRRIIQWSKTRIYKLNDLTTPDMKFLWIAPSIDKTILHTKEFDVDSVLPDLVQKLDKLPFEAFEKIELASFLKMFSSEKGIKFSALMHALRMILTGLKQGPSIGEIMELTGKCETLRRLKVIVNCNKEACFTATQF